MKSYNLNDTAKAVRSTLKAAFPQTVFSVRSKRYAGGCSISVHWTDGPTGSQVTPLLDCFERCGFDGMQDMKTYEPPVEWHGEAIEWGSDYVQGQRRVSDELMREAALFVAFEGDLPLLKIGPHGVEGGNYLVPFVMFKREDGGMALAHDSHKGEWYQQLVCQVAWNISREATQPVELPKRVTESYIAAKVAEMVA
jgi:hypothetical protein